ncbi:restriction endonuclease subunit S [Microbacterium marinilacus]|uniref:restriction endonuclease subunit S n=1 Tax=Microbacterium marinilacus TaxID=415209 RepID=UPI001C8DB5D6|nr:restriction endonuclease subunit S [Microbacterium marinilacus]MBY0690279.1 restriction endonuclease subunit S [Microbacterium marinilacus]
MKDGYVDSTDVRSVLADDVEASRYGLRPGDVLFTEGGDFDKLGRGCVWDGSIDPCLHQNHVFAVRPDPRVLLPEFLAALAASPHGRRYFVGASKQSTNLASINSSQLKKFPVPLPPLTEQRRIAEILRAWDDAIERVRLLLSRTQKRYDAAAERLAGSANGAHARLGDVTRELTERNAGRLDRTAVRGVSNTSGISMMRGQAVSIDVSRYLVLPPRAFAYNPMRINIGSIAMSRLDAEVLVSPDYVLFACEETRLIPAYLDHVLKTRRWRHDVNAGASGSVRTRTYYAELAAIRVHLPDLERQRAIATALDAVREELTLLGRELELLRTQKRGLMQKLLSGDVRVPLDEEPSGD